MLKVKIEPQPCIRCPVDDKYHFISLCKGCDAYKGEHEILGKGGKIPTAIKCDINSM